MLAGQYPNENLYIALFGYLIVRVATTTKRLGTHYYIPLARKAQEVIVIGISLMFNDYMDTRAAIEEDIRSKGSVNLEHLKAFVKLIPTNDAEGVKTAVKTWLQRLHDDPTLTTVHFPTEVGTETLGVPGNSIDRVLSDLESYGRLTHETLIGAEPNIYEPKDSNEQ